MIEQISKWEKETNLFAKKKKKNPNKFCRCSTLNKKDYITSHAQSAGCT